MDQPAPRTMPQPAHRRTIPLGRLWMFVILGAVCLPAATRAANASPPPTVAPTRLPPETTTQVWFDEPLPDDAPVGGSVTIGFSLFDQARLAFSDAQRAAVLVHPMTGRATPTEAIAQSDWPGHLTAAITIPKGGAGLVEVGLVGDGCQGVAAGCPVTPLTIAGIGPPSDARTSALLVATIRLPGGPYGVGVPIDLDVEVGRRANWDPGTVPFPDHLVALASDAHGESLASADLSATPADGGHYSGAIAIGQPGEAALVVAARPERGADAVLESSRTRLTVAAGVGGAPPVVTVPISGETVPMLPLLAVIALLIVVTIVVKRGLADF